MLIHLSYTVRSAGPNLFLVHGRGLHIPAAVDIGRRQDYCLPANRLHWF
ncbi:hypothetical protein I545_6103 [Mycobacterium kansasii 662]|uniref:Uncharacterized protein n=2 Tax=Mycobacterium kansasii TaxID=1768 RepID=A0A1V3XF67_MYCKA|nr:hypothetical protein I545_6103 [Mycobacterium kansasii 662]OOK77837.1 hypothetical protein BZL29_4042 [Mycobacterium kansasii]